MSLDKPFAGPFCLKCGKELEHILDESKREDFWVHAATKKAECTAAPVPAAPENTQPFIATPPINDGGPAFPAAYNDSSCLTVRDYFAAKMLPIIAQVTGEDGTIPGDVRKAYEYADAAIAERAKQ